jgi:hypothetical protein
MVGNFPCLKWVWVAAAVIGLSSATQAATLLDTSPDTIGLANPLTPQNTDSSQNFVTKLVLTDDYHLTGMDSYGLGASGGFGPVGTPVTIRIFTDFPGAPASLFAEISSTISISDLDGNSSSETFYARRHAAFSQNLGAGTYWIGMSGTNLHNLTQLLVNDAGITLPQTAVMNGQNLFFIRFAQTNEWDQASIRVYGDALPNVPLPAALPLFATGLGLMGLLGWRRKRSGWARGSVAAAAAALCASLALTTPSKAATVIGGSDLLVGAGLAQVESWLVNDPQLAYNGSLQFTNIFDKAAGNTAAQFHNAVDGQGPTVVLMEARVSGSTGPYQTIGGFNPQSWSQLGGYQLTPSVGDRTAFIFNLSAGDRRDQQVADSGGQFQTFYQLNYGPTFGGGHDIHIDNTLNSGSLVSLSYCANPASTCSWVDGGLNLLGLTNPIAFFLFGDPNLPVPKVTELEIRGMEVFTIAETAAIPLPGALPLFLTGLAGLGVLGWRRKRSA